MRLLSRGFELGWGMSQRPKRFTIQSALTRTIRRRAVRNLQRRRRDHRPATGRTPAERERIRVTVEIARFADEGARAAALRWRIDEAVGELRSCLTGVERRRPVDGFEQVIPFKELLKRER